MSVESAVRAILSAVDRKIAAAVAFRATVTAVDGSLIQIQREGASTAGTEDYASCTRFILTVGDVVLCIPLGGKPVIIDVIRRSAAPIYPGELSGLPDPGADRILFWDDSAGHYEYLSAGSGLAITGTSIAATGSGGSIVVQEGDVTVDAVATTIDFDASDFNVTSSPAGEANIALNYGTSAGTPAEGNHTHTALTVSEGGTPVDSSALIINMDATDFNVSSSPAGTANISLAYGTSANTPAEGNHTHAASLIVSEGGTPTDSAVTTINFDATDFNTTSSPAGTANVSLAYGTSANTPAEGNHAHTLADLSDVTAAAPGSAAGKVLAWDGASAWDDYWVYCETLGPWYLNDVPGTATTSMALLYFNTGTAVSQSTNRIRAGRTGWIVGMKITSDAARTGGTCTARIDLSGVGTAFDAGSVVLDATRTTQDATIVTVASAIQITSGGDTIGVQAVTSGWTPTTADIQVSVLVIWDPIS